MTDMHNTIIDIRDLAKTYRIRRGGTWREIRALDNISLAVRRGETLGIVGESGCGKSTLGRAILRLVQPDAGALIHDGTDLLTLGRRDLAAARLKIRMVFQDPYASLNPRRSVGDSVAELGDIHGVFASRRDRAARVADTLDRVGLGARFAASFPHELSGGQRQRVGIARAILPEPEIIIADEPVSALDVSIQAQVLNLLAELKERLDLTLMFISHDLGVVAAISDRVAVLYMGRVVEVAPAREIFDAPLHPYTRLLMAAIPRPDPATRITGDVELGEPPRRFQALAGCPFRERCPHATDFCREMTPPLRGIAPERFVACHYAEVSPAW